MSNSDWESNPHPQAHEEDVTRHTFDWSTTSPSIGVIELIERVTECDPLSIDPLYQAVDPDALDALFRKQRDGPNETTVTFQFVGHIVTVQGNGVVELRPINSGPSQSYLTTDH